MFEIACQDSQAAAVRQAVCKEREKRSADDRAQSYACPGKDQNRKSCPIGGRGVSLRRREDIDHAAEKDRLGEQRQSHGYIGNRQKPTQTAVSAKLCENADVELQKAHGTDFSRLSPYLLSAGGSGRGSTADGVGWTGAGVVQALKSASETFGSFLRKATIDQISSS